MRSWAPPRSTRVRRARRPALEQIKVLRLWDFGVLLWFRYHSLRSCRHRYGAIRSRRPRPVPGTPAWNRCGICLVHLAGGPRVGQSRRSGAPHGDTWKVRPRHRQPAAWRGRVTHGADRSSPPSPARAAHGGHGRSIAIYTERPPGDTCSYPAKPLAHRTRRHAEPHRGLTRRGW